MAEKPIVLGIDLGTTNTCVAYVRNKIARVVPSDKGALILPSVVAMSEKGELLVGNVAKDQMVVNPRNTIYGAKRLIGRKFNSKVVQDIKHYFSYEIVEGSEGEAAVVLGNRVYSLPQISAFVLQHCKRVAEATLGQEIHEAIVPVPAYYNDNQPTAAALAYGLNRGFDHKVLVYDLGGGTFDVSILQLHGNVMEVLATGGDTFLGGVDFDNRIIEVDAAQEGVAARGQHLHDVAVQLQDGDVEGAAAQVVDQDLVVEAAVQAVGERGGGGLVVVVVGGHRDDGLVDLLAERGLGDALAVLQDEGADLRQRIDAVAEDDRGFPFAALDDLVREVVLDVLHHLGVELAPDEPLGA